MLALAYMYIVFNMIATASLGDHNSTAGLSFVTNITLQEFASSGTSHLCFVEIGIMKEGRELCDCYLCHIACHVATLAL